IDIVLLDLSLPDSQGFDTLIQMHKAAMGIPIVVLAGIEDETLGLQLIQHGAQDYLVKGQVTASHLQRSLRYAVERGLIVRELREKMNLLQSVLDSVADGVVMASETGEFKVWNPAAERIIGTGPANMATESWSAHFGLFLPDRVTPYPSEDLPLVRAIRGEPVNEILVFLKPSGSKETWLSVNARPLHDGTGHVKGGVAVFRDITEQTRTEQERQKLARDRLLLLDSTGDGMYGIDLEGRCTFINKAGAQMFGYLPRELMGQDMHQLIHHSFPDGTPYPRKDCHIFEVFRSGRGCQIDHEVFWRKDGTAFPVDYTSFPVYEQDTMTGAVVTFLDITARRRLEDELTQRAARLVKQQSALTDLTQSRCFQSSALMPTLQRITEMAARTLAVERVGIWRYTDDRTAIQCMDLYELSHARHAAEMALPVHSFPGYFDALVTSRIIAADDAHTDDRTAGFSAEYLSRIGISSLMDVPIYLFGRLEGVICHEHVGPPRRWTEDEQMFAVAVSNLVTLAYEQG
ncbi:MAG: PAS domain S-box protein, partial [Nitrospiraceae bacterium]